MPKSIQVVLEIGARVRRFLQGSTRGYPKKTMPCLISCNVKTIKTISEKLKASIHKRLT